MTQRKLLTKIFGGEVGRHPDGQFPLCGDRMLIAL